MLIFPLTAEMQEGEAQDLLLEVSDQRWLLENVVHNMAVMRYR